MNQLSFNLEYTQPEKETKKPKRIRNKNPKKKILYQVITTEDGSVINDYDNWRTLRGYAVELYKLCGFIPFFGAECIEQDGIRVWHDVYEREPYEHQGVTFMGQKFEHYEAEVIGTEFMPVIERITIYKEILSRLYNNMALKQAVNEVIPIIEGLKNGISIK